MKVEDLKGTKIYLSNEEDRIKFQKKVFKLGVKWPVSGKNVVHREHMFYYINSDLMLSFSDVFNRSSFIGNDSMQIFLDEVLSIEEPKEEFKPFDRVLVRNTEDDKWRPREYASLDVSDKFGLVYGTTDGCYRKYCIPYKGNEELANTTKSPEQ